MFRRLLAKGNLHRSDHLRALVTDTSPGDIPIIFSNDGLYNNCKGRSSGNTHQWELIDRILIPERSYTVPYRYNILRSGGKARRISLIHPASQLEVCNFYRDFGHLVCYYSRKSQVSIRSPRKIGQTYFIRGSVPKDSQSAFSMKSVDLGEGLSNPATFFAYSGHNRAFRFFESADYLRLEKRYSVMHFADITKCFSSIYTHTVFWATADVRTAKDNTHALNFSNQFDRLMKSMNYNETNGICIGAEVSRVFAEIILSEIDRQVIAFLRDRGSHYRRDYEFRRYVDDYYIFSKDVATSNKVLAAISMRLSEYGMHLNADKTHAVPRPFITAKSRLVREANRHLEEFFQKFLKLSSNNGVTYIYPRRIRRPGAVLRSLLDSVKGACFDHQSGYELISNYVIGALGSRIASLIADYETGIRHEAVSEDDYVGALLLLLDAVYFFYNVDPTVPSSFRVAQAATQCAEFFKDHIPTRLPFLAEQIVRWTFQFIRSLSGSTVHRDTNCVPLEALNILLVFGEVGREDALAQQTISEFCGTATSLEYFEIISFLFCMGDSPKFAALRGALFERARDLLKDSLGVRTDSQVAHLALDLLACPHLDEGIRATLFNDLRVEVGLPQVPQQQALDAVKCFEDKPWFVNWKSTELLSMIRKKELSDVY